MSSPRASQLPPRRPAQPDQPIAIGSAFGRVSSAAMASNGMTRSGDRDEQRAPVAEVVIEGAAGDAGLLRDGVEAVAPVRPGHDSDGSLDDPLACLPRAVGQVVAAIRQRRPQPRPPGRSGSRRPGRETPARVGDASRRQAIAGRTRRSAASRIRSCVAAPGLVGPCLTSVPVSVGHDKSRLDSHTSMMAGQGRSRRGGRGQGRRHAGGRGDDLRKSFGAIHAVDGITLSLPAGSHLRPPGPQRLWQDDAHPPADRPRQAELRSGARPRHADAVADQPRAHRLHDPGRRHLRRTVRLRERAVLRHPLWRHRSRPRCSTRSARRARRPHSTLAGELSGGMRRRLSLACALVHSRRSPSSTSRPWASTPRCGSSSGTTSDRSPRRARRSSSPATSWTRPTVATSWSSCARAA